MSIYTQWQISPSSPKSWRSPNATENLHLGSSPKPSPSILASNQVLLRIQAASINARDIMVIARDPIYAIDNIENLVPCADGAGIVEAVGSDSVWKVGDRVLIQYSNWIDGFDVPDLVGLGGKGAGSVQGTLREYGVFPDEHLVRAPTHLTIEEAASLGMAAGTAANALFFCPRPVQSGITVLTQGTGGVSCFAIQLASSAGATVISTSSSDTKLSIAKSLGATHLINYTTHPNWEEEVLRLTNGEGVDHVIENGGAQTLGQSLKCTKQGGLISIVGLLAGPFIPGENKIDVVTELLFGGKTLRGIFGSSRVHIVDVVERFEKYGLRPAIARLLNGKMLRRRFFIRWGILEWGRR